MKIDLSFRCNRLHNAPFVKDKHSKEMSVSVVIAISTLGGFLMAGLTLLFGLGTANSLEEFSFVQIALFAVLLFVVGFAIVFCFAAMMYWQERQKEQ